MDSLKTLPDQIDNNVISMFLSSMISIISLKEDDNLWHKCMKLLTKYLRNDTNLRSKFKPNSLILKKMNFDYWLSTPEYTRSAVELITFLLRNYRDLDYESFSDKIDIVNLLRRSEMLKCWEDLETLGLTFDEFHSKSQTE